MVVDCCDWLKMMADNHMQEYVNSMWLSPFILYPLFMFEVAWLIFEISFLSMRDGKKMDMPRHLIRIVAMSYCGQSKTKKELF